ncbi:MAG: hypothetical protein ACJASQ_002709 [Crocinitomicaceae bacterium]|jgi:hypothetical protein
MLNRTPDPKCGGLNKRRAGVGLNEQMLSSSLKAFTFIGSADTTLIEQLAFGSERVGASFVLDLFVPLVFKSLIALSGSFCIKAKMNI